MDRVQLAGRNRTAVRQRLVESSRVVLVRRRPRHPLHTRTVLLGSSPEEDACWFAKQMSRKYPRLTSTDKRQVLTVLRKALPPQSLPGRPRRADVTEALLLESQGVSRKEIYRR